jgi:hypothetical protein
MPLPKDFSEQLPLRTDEDLFGALARQEDYLPEALAAIRAELRRRDLSLDREQEIKVRALAQLGAEKRQTEPGQTWPPKWPQILGFITYSTALLGLIAAKGPLLGIIALGIIGIVIALFWLACRLSSWMDARQEKHSKKSRNERTKD